MSPGIMKNSLAILSIVLLSCLHSCAAGATVHKADVCVYGGTASGVMAAVAAAREGADVIIVEPSRWLGGMTGGGISHLDWGRKEAVGGSTYDILKGQPGNEVYRKIFKDLIVKLDMKVIYDHRLGKVRLDGCSIRSVSLDYAPVDETGCPIARPEKANAATVTAKVFLDCSYEGDLMAGSQVSYTWPGDVSRGSSTANPLPGCAPACGSTTSNRIASQATGTVD